MNRLLCLMLILIFYSGAVFAQAQTATVTARRANVRKEPNLTAPVVTRLPRGKQIKIEIVDVVLAENGWYYLAGSDVKGWIHESVFRFEEKNND